MRYVLTSESRERVLGVGCFWFVIAAERSAAGQCLTFSLGCFGGPMDEKSE